MRCRLTFPTPPPAPTLPTPHTRIPPGRQRVLLSARTWKNEEWGADSRPYGTGNNIYRCACVFSSPPPLLPTHACSSSWPLPHPSPQTWDRTSPGLAAGLRPPVCPPFHGPPAPKPACAQDSDRVPPIACRPLRNLRVARIPMVSELRPDGSAAFSDGRVEQGIDAVIYATGYQYVSRRCRG